MCAQSITNVILWTQLFISTGYSAKILDIRFLTSDVIDQDGRGEDTGNPRMYDRQTFSQEENPRAVYQKIA